MGASGSKSAKAETLAAAAEIAQQSQPPSPARPGAPEGNSRVVPVSPGTRAANSQPAPAVEPGGGGGAAVRRERPIVQQHIIAGSPASSCGGLPVEKLESPNSHELDDEALASEYMANQATVSSTPRSGGIEHAAMGGSSIPSIMVGGGGGGGGGDGGGDGSCSPPLPTGGVSGSGVAGGVVVKNAAGGVGVGGAAAGGGAGGAIGGVPQKLSFGGGAGGAGGGAGAGGGGSSSSGAGGGGGGGEGEAVAQRAPATGVPISWQRGQLLGAGSFGCARSHSHLTLHTSHFTLTRGQPLGAGSFGRPP